MRYNFEHDLQIEKKYIASIKLFGPKCTATSKKIEDKIIAFVEKNKNSKEKSLKVLNFQLGEISHMSVLRMLKKRNIMHKNLYRSQFSIMTKKS